MSGLMRRLLLFDSRSQMAGSAKYERRPKPQTGVGKCDVKNKKARTNAGLSKFWLLDLGSNQGPTD